MEHTQPGIWEETSANALAGTHCCEHSCKRILSSLTLLVPQGGNSLQQTLPLDSQDAQVGTEDRRKLDLSVVLGLP